MRSARHPGFALHLRVLLPHALLGRFSRLVARTRRSRRIVDLGLRRWIEHAAVRMEELLPRPLVSAGAFFRRHLRPGARPIADGFIAPADGVVASAGPIARGMILQLDGVPLDLERPTRGDGPELPLSTYGGGRYITLSLPPRGCHDVHMPTSATLLEVRWTIDERNERTTLRCRSDDGHEFLLVLVGANLLGDIHLEGLERAAWARREPLRCDRHFARGARLGRCGATVVILVSPALAGLPPFIGAELRMGQKLYPVRKSTS